MKKLILFLFLVNFFTFCDAQVIRGTIFDKTDNTRIGLASVYISGTYVGAYSDQNGYFELDIKKYSSLPITISALGYYSVTLTDFSKDKPLQVFLTPKMFELNQVLIKGKSLARERKENLKLFKSEFLGTSDNAQRCVILNEKDIRFNYGSSDDTLKAFAAKPILIYNKGLGYKITYFLDKFEYYKKNEAFLYQGSAVFNEDMNSERSPNKFFERRRSYAYLGSRSHFFSSLWDNQLKSNGFTIRNSAGEILNYEDIVVKDSLGKYLIPNKNLKVFNGLKTPKSITAFLKDNAEFRIFYLSKTPNSYIEFLKDSVYFDGSGYFDGSAVRIEGQLAVKRIGDLLPFGYKTNEILITSKGKK